MSMQAVSVFLFFLVAKVEVIRMLVCDQGHSVVFSRGQQLAAHPSFYIKFF